VDFDKINQIKKAVEEFEPSELIDIKDIDLLINEIKNFIKTDKSIGKDIGPLIGRLCVIKTKLCPPEKNTKPRKRISGVTDKSSYWVKVNNGFLKIGHKTGGINRPFASLAKEKTTAVLNLGNV